MKAGSPPASAPFTSPFSSEAKGSLVFHSGWFGASTATRWSAKRSWKYKGCSAHKVPSLSNVAMRAEGGTKSGEPSFVTRATKSNIDFFGAVLLQDGSGSVSGV